MPVCCPWIGESDAPDCRNIRRLSWNRRRWLRTFHDRSSQWPGPTRWLKSVAHQHLQEPSQIHSEFLYHYELKELSNPYRPPVGWHYINFLKDLSTSLTLDTTHQTITSNLASTPRNLD